MLANERKTHERKQANNIFSQVKMKQKCVYMCRPRKIAIGRLQQCKLTAPVA